MAVSDEDLAAQIVTAETFVENETD